MINGVEIQKIGKDDHLRRFQLLVLLLQRKLREAGQKEQEERW
jgi:hypothetical protein